MRNAARDILLGVTIGDALGVPVEFISRGRLALDPVQDMRAFGSHHQPAGTWSDDSSLTLCLAEMLCEEYDLKRLAGYFINWKAYAYWTAHSQVFDIGIATSAAIYELGRGVDPVLAGGNTEDSNGNGSLMRILPLLLHIKDLPIEERFRHVQEVSSLTHRHIRSVIACFIYLEYALQLLYGRDKQEGLSLMRTSVNDFLKTRNICPEAELNKFHRILENPIQGYELVPLSDCVEDEIYSSGYVLHTLEASIWCLLDTEDYASAVLKAVNLGNDTDTTAAVTGGLAGLLYGYENIPQHWLAVLARRKDIEALSDRLQEKYW